MAEPETKRKPLRIPYVGAMGVLVFSVALRHWLEERRRFRERDAGA